MKPLAPFPRLSTSRQLKSLFILSLVTLTLFSGCVKKSTYELLQSQYAEEQATSADLRQELSAMTQNRDTLSADRDRLNAELEAEQRKAAELLKDRSSLQSSVEEMQGALREQRRRQAEAEARIASFRALIDRFRPLIDMGKLHVKIADGRMVLVLATDILFDKGSAELSEAGREAIMEVASVLSAFPDRAFQVEGHTDNDPISTQRYPSNWELASARALNVVKTLVEGGLPASQVSGASYGEYKPIGENETDEGKSMNRRIEIVILPDLSKLPGFDELQRLEPTSPKG